MFIPESKLHCIPFYDLYAIREASKVRPDYEQLRKANQKNINDYLKKIRHFNRSVKKVSE